MAQKSAAERIREYKQLLDEGMITQEEFELKKAKILEAEDAELKAEAEQAKKEENVFSGH
ncbi:MAG: SHOCT domain-containing protein, partial [Firmicutes bacterium]|nr:SHOCT domain-containing protein [Bacillota bacterium]